ncbi:hypothetical protein ACNS7O_09010 [Haloferacaceae archaeon DSL9]
MAYVVEIKPSARRHNAAVGREINRAGTRRRFETRAAAERWASDLSAGDDRVWVRSADPADAAPVDGYLVSRKGTPPLAGAFDKRRRRLRGGRTTSQRRLPGIEPNG